ncbi:SIMPL domain-containing protein [Anaerobacillus sp. CMMVII]|uniref:SIMPL domain-containing protein n=1 Tax=Anaerobacillus sp. CMMVII TaxID=2755588 RepID=UPI0021B7D1E0|nr:SIMPL domain-containing protein [Anaerobacillus sp. CMMVII]MCT8138356.1 SIMPL domain-containing protein [Anaerobacillus sp. CMMVII]
MYYPQVFTKCLKVSGEGKISVSPNQAKITLGVITENVNLQQAQAENSQITTNVISSLTQLGIPQENIQTVVYRIEPLYDYRDGVQQFRGYQVTHQLQITINQIAQTGQIVDLAVSQGANTVTNIEFTVSQPEAYYNEALKLALNNAFTKATALTANLPVNLNPVPFKIEETLTPPPPVPFATTMLAKAEASTPIQPGEITISATITVHYFYF